MTMKLQVEVDYGRLGEHSPSQESHQNERREERKKKEIQGVVGRGNMMSCLSFMRNCYERERSEPN